MDQLTPADIAAVQNGGRDGFGGSGFWIFALLILLFGCNGSFFGNGGGRAATVEDLNNSANFTRLENQVMNNGNLINRNTDIISNGLSSLGYEMATQFGNVRNAIDTCCCTTQRNIDSVRYDNLQNTYALQQAIQQDGERTRAQVQNIYDTIQKNKIEALQNQVNQLQLQSAMCGVVRYPLQSTYAVNCNPFGMNPCCGNI